MEQLCCVHWERVSSARREALFQGQDVPTRWNLLCPRHWARAFTSCMSHAGPNTVLLTLQMRRARLLSVISPARNMENVE